MSDLPARPPEAELLRRARNRMRLSIREAAARASRTMPSGSGGRDGISEGRLRQIEAGYQTVSKGIQVPTSASADTLAYLAKFYGITPAELKSAGRPDGAVILQDIEASAPAPPALRVVPTLDSDTDPAESLLAALVKMYGEGDDQDSNVVRLLANQFGHGKPAATIVREIREWLRVTGQTERSNGTSA